MECMERAFLMSPTEAIQGAQQGSDSSPGDSNVYSTELCAQFVEVLERGREARKREVAELEQRIAKAESLCSSWAEALANEREERQLEVAELRQALEKEREARNR